jgi:hypothetical protein
LTFFRKEEQDDRLPLLYHNCQVSPAGLDTMVFLSTLFQKQYATIIAKAFQDQTDISLGKIAFTFGSSAGLPFYKSAIQQAGKVTNWGIAPGPHSTPNPVVDAYGPSVTISARGAAES